MMATLFRFMFMFSIGTAIGGAIVDIMEKQGSYEWWQMGWAIVLVIGALTLPWWHEESKL